VYARLSYVVVALALVAVSGGCLGSDGFSRVNTKESVLLVDELRGTFVGVALGDSRAEVRRRLGSAACREDGLITPVGTDPTDVGGLYVGEYRARKPGGPYKGCVMRYRGVVFVVDVPDGVVSMGTTDPRARTRRGVRIGDSADVVRQRYPGAECQGRDGGFWAEDAMNGGLQASEGDRQGQLRAHEASLRARPGRRARDEHLAGRSLMGSHPAPSATMTSDLEAWLWAKTTSPGASDHRAQRAAPGKGGSPGNTVATAGRARKGIPQRDAGRGLQAQRGNASRLAVGHGDLTGLRLRA